MTERIFYVSPTGSDENPGTSALPFRTVSHARDVARTVDGAATVEVLAGTYRETLAFDQNDSGDTYRANGEVIFTGGMTVPYAVTEALSDEVKAVLTPDAAAHVRVIDLGKLGIGRDVYENLFAVGAYHTQGYYDGHKCGTNVEVFSDDRRMTLARYPNDRYLKLDGVLEDCERPGKRNPYGGKYIVDEETAERMRSWKFPETAWTFAYFGFDWSDSSSPIAFDPDERSISPLYTSYYTTAKGNLYYLYNVLDELDVPGEFFIDRKNGLLYVYPYTDGTDIELSLSTASLITIGGTENLTISGFTLTCVRGTALRGSGRGITLDNLTVKNVADHAIELNGSDNTVQNCTIYHTGKGGIFVSGGDRPTLTPGNCRILNNYIHDFGEIYRTYQPGISMQGVGNYCAHNELCHSPHAAMTYGGNCHLIEYNYIHHVVQHSHDAGAIYSGGDPIGHGTVIRYNLLRSIGNETFHPDGIYWDDGLSGQTAYGNLLIDVGRFSIIAGGGRDHVIRDNLILGDCWDAIHYDDRFREGFLKNGENDNLTGTLDRPFWGTLKVCPYQSALWVSRFPTLAKLSSDLGHPDDPYFALNPGGSLVENNVIVNSEERLGAIWDSVYRYSTIGENPVYRSVDDIDFDMETLKFRHPREGFPDIPADKIGRYPDKTKEDV